MLEPSGARILKKTILAVSLFFCAIPFVCAQEKDLSTGGNGGYLVHNDAPAPVENIQPEAPKAPVRREFVSYTTKHSQREAQELLREQARKYRDLGLGMQRTGNLDSAMSFYQKALELDRFYPVAYNDLGIIYEAKGLYDRATDAYLMAVKIDPNYLSAYSNLALMYENMHELEKAAVYWEKRAELGSPSDPWTQKARMRLDDIRLVIGKKPLVPTREQEILAFMNDVSSNLEPLKKEAVRKTKNPARDNKDASADYFEKAKLSYAKGDSVMALRQAMEAEQLDPSNTNIANFIDELQKKLLSR